jgi:hypothetical protein
VKNVRADLLIATLALLASSGATLSSVYQTHVIANQLSASVWPYLEAVYSYGSNTAQLEIANDGLGPALVRSATLSVDGHTVASYRRGIDALERGFHVQHPYSGSFSSIGPSSVVRPGQQVALFNLSRTPVKGFGSFQRRVALDMCYCSLLGQCWVYRSGPVEIRDQVGTCPTNAGLDF